MHKVIKVIFFTGVIVTSANYFEFITGINFAHLFPNVSSVLELWVEERVAGIPRVFGLRADPVVTSYYLTFVFPLGLYLFHIEKKKKWIYLTIFIVVGSVLNFTRASMFSITVLLLVYSFMINRKRLIYTSVTLIGLGVLITIDNPLIRMFSDTLNVIFDSNQSNNVDYIRSAGLFDRIPSMITNIPFWGIGTGSLIRHDLMLSYFAKVGFLFFSDSIRTELPFFITTLLDSGYIVSISFLFLLIICIKKSYSLVVKSKNRKTQIESYLFLIFIGYFICLTANGIVDSFSIIFIFIGLLNFVIKTKARIS